MSEVPNGLPLSQKHWDELNGESGLGEGIIRGRGYYTTSDVRHLIEVCLFPEYQVPPGEYLVIPHRDNKGEITNYQIKPSVPRPKPDGSKPAKYELPAGALNRLDIPNQNLLHLALQSKDIPLYITEGSKKADAGAQHGLCILSVNGVFGWRGENDLGGTTTLADWEEIALKGRLTHIVFDSDVMTKPQVRNALVRLARWLKKRGARVHAIVLRIDGVDGKLGLDDYLAHPLTTAKDLPSLVDDSVLREPTDEDGIRVTGRSGSEIYHDALGALLLSNDPPCIFVRAGELAKVVDDGFNPPRIETLGMSGLRNRLTTCSRWHKLVKDGKEIVPSLIPHCPPDVVEHFLAERLWPGIPPLISITRAPVLSKSGALTTRPGYCPETFFFLSHRENWPEFTGTVQDAADYIFNDILGDFPFVSDTDRAHALALILLPIVRPAIDGATPLHLFDAPTPGTGKSLLARACLRITQEYSIKAMPFPEKEEEIEKKIHAELTGGAPYIMWDNVKQRVKSAAFEVALTGDVFQGRTLGLSKMSAADVRCAWVMTANNADLGDDITDRSVLIQLDAKMERPRERKGFKHKNVEAYITRNRPKIIAALCKIVTNWVEAGMPAYEEAIVMGSYEAWANVIGGILQTANIPGFLGNIQILREARNPEHAAWAAFCNTWYETFFEGEIRAKSLIETFEAQEALAGSLGTGNDASKLSRLGKALRARANQIFGGFQIVDMGPNIGWKLRVVGKEAVQTGVEAAETGVHFTPLPDDSNLEPLHKTGVTGVTGVVDDPTRTHAHTHCAREGAEHPLTPVTPVQPLSEPESDEIVRRIEL